MSQLNLPVCPICQARDSLSPETMNRGEQSFLWYECAECGSVLLSAGDDRWAYQKVGREDKGHLLKQSMTVAELQALVEVPDQPSVEPELAVHTVPAEALDAPPEPPSVEPEPAVHTVPAVALEAPPEPVTPVPEKKKRGPLLWVVILGLVLVGLCLACGVLGLLVGLPFGNEAAATPTPIAAAGEAATPADAAAPGATPIPADASQATDTPPPADRAGAALGGDLDPSSLTTPANLSSYRSTMSIVITQIVDGQVLTETVGFETAFTSDPLAQHVSITGAGIEGAGGMQSVEWYQVGDSMYVDLGTDEWVSLPAGEGEDLAAGLVTPDALLDDTCGWQSQGTTTLDGIQVERWTTTKAQMDACMPAGLLTGIGNLTDAGGEMFVALDGSYVVQMDFFYAGTNLDLGISATDQPVGEGRLDFSYKLMDVNQPFSIDLPPGAQAAASGPEDIPIPENAQETTNMGGLITFISPDTPVQLADYYKTQMPGFGWSEVSAEDLGAMVMLEFTKEGKTASIMLQPADGGGTSALITTE